MNEPNQTPTEPTPTQTTEPTADPAPANQEPAVNDPAPGTLAEPAPTSEPEPQQATEPQSPTEPEPSEPQEPQEPEARVVPKPSEYELPEGLPDNLRIFAHEHGFTQDQLNATLQQFGGYMQGMQQAEAQAMRQMGEAHVKNWGPEAKQNLVLAKSAMGWLNEQIDGFADYINNSPAGNNPQVLQALYLVGKSMQEGGFLKGKLPRDPAQQTAAQAMYGSNHPTKG